jgi:hypothetical protein
VDHTHFPWRPLGALLVEQGLLSASELDRALAEQRRSGRLLGQVLVRRGYVSGSSLVRVLAEQHGVGLRPTRAPEKPSTKDRAQTPDRSWRPLGRVLVEKGFVTTDELARVLWTYSEARADAKAASRQNLVRTFGFDPVRWGTPRG